MFDHALNLELHVAKLQPLDHFAQVVFRPAHVNERAQQHVAADAGETIKVGDGHWSSASGTCDNRSRVNMRCAAAAAPRPLSMLTTVNPVAQLLSMPSSAARPLKLAPYPTLVGTAITQLSTRPPTTLGKAPSIPATTITTSASFR